MASKKEFTAIQAKLDEIGIITCINRIIANKQYEVIVNGEIVKKYKQRRSAKNYILRSYYNKKQNQ